MSFRWKSLFSRQEKVETAPAATGDMEPVGPIHSSAELDAAQQQRNRNWIGVDLDGTLAYFDGWQGLEIIGEPVPEMKARVLSWLEHGYRVKIFTARASVPEGTEPVRRWLEKHGFPPLEITNSKDFGMIELWDDRAVQIVRNTGSAVISPKWDARPRAPFFHKSAETPQGENPPEKKA